MDTTKWVGGDWFEKISLVLEALGHEAPAPMVFTSNGNYVANLVSQYQNDLSAAQVTRLCEYVYTQDQRAIEEMLADFGPDVSGIAELVLGA